MTSLSDYPKFSSINDFAKLLGISRNTVIDNYLHRKGFPVTKIGKKIYRIKTKEAIEFIEKNPIRRGA